MCPYRPVHMSLTMTRFTLTYHTHHINATRHMDRLCGTFQLMIQERVKMKETKKNWVKRQRQHETEGDCENVCCNTNDDQFISMKIKYFIDLEFYVSSSSSYSLIVYIHESWWTMMKTEITHLNVVVVVVRNLNLNVCDCGSFFIILLFGCDCDFEYRAFDFWINQIELYKKTIRWETKTGRTKTPKPWNGIHRLSDKPMCVRERIMLNDLTDRQTVKHACTKKNISLYVLVNE